MTILALVVTGIANVFVAAKKYIQHSRSRMTGGELGKKFLDPIQAYVRQDTWSSNPLGTDSIDDIAKMEGYSADYTTGSLTGEPNIKRVTVSIKKFSE